MTRRPLVVVPDFLTEASLEQRVLEDVADVRALANPDENELLRQAPEADVLIFFHEVRLTGRSLAQLSRCKGAIRCGVGVDNIDLKTAGQLGIVVCNVPDYGTEEVADHALMMLLASARRLLLADRDIRAGRWDVSTVFGTPRLRGKTLGIVGCGRIGTAMVLRAKALGMRVVVHDPFRPDGLDKMLGVERCYHLPELLRQATFLSLHCPLTPQTHHLLRDETLQLLPQGAYVINTS